MAPTYFSFLHSGHHFSVGTNRSIHPNTFLLHLPLTHSFHFYLQVTVSTTKESASDADDLYVRKIAKLQVNPLTAIQQVRLELVSQLVTAGLEPKVIEAYIPQLQRLVVMGAGADEPLR